MTVRVGARLVMLSVLLMTISKIVHLVFGSFSRSSSRSHRMHRSRRVCVFRATGTSSKSVFLRVFAFSIVHRKSTVQGISGELGLQFGVFSTLSMNFDRFGIDNAFVFDAERPETGNGESEMNASHGVEFDEHTMA